MFFASQASTSDPGYLASIPEAWAYVTLGASAIATEELATILGGFAAQEGRLGFVRVVLVCALGVFVLSAALFGIGWWRSAWVRLKLRRSPPIVRKLLRAMRYSPWRTTILTRFVIGGRIALLLTCGAARVRPWIFFAGTAVSSVVWALLFASLGWGFGQGAVLVLGGVRRYEGWIVALLIALGVAVYLWVRRRQQQAAARTVPRHSPDA